MREPASFHFVQLHLDARKLFEVGRLQRLPIREVDIGYLAHSRLRELFGDKGPQPFALGPSVQRWMTVLGYADHDAAELKEHAQAFAGPELWEVCDWSRAASKPMPLAWRPGQRVGFEARICPVVRMAKDGPTHRKGAEVDAFLARCWSAGKDTPVDREAVYREWLTAQFVRAGGVEVVETKVKAFQRERLLRRTQGEQRTAARCERPDVTMTGVLEIREGGAFNEMLRRGIGRHRAFGFGMLLLRRPE